MENIIEQNKVASQSILPPDTSVDVSALTNNSNAPIEINLEGYDVKQMGQLESALFSVIAKYKEAHKLMIAADRYLDAHIGTHEFELMTEHDTEPVTEECSADIVGCMLKHLPKQISRYEALHKRVMEEIIDRLEHPFYQENCNGWWY